MRIFAAYLGKMPHILPHFWPAIFPHIFQKKSRYKPVPYHMHSKSQHTELP